MTRHETARRAQNGLRAVRLVMDAYPGQIEGKHLPVIIWEGYSAVPYRDTKGVVTVGVGQTGYWADIPFPEVFDHFEQQARHLTTGFDELPQMVKDAIVVACYRGDWQVSPKTRRLFNNQMYLEAAEEWYDNEDYRVACAQRSGVKDRFEYVGACIEYMILNEYVHYGED